MPVASYQPLILGLWAECSTTVLLRHKSHLHNYKPILSHSGVVLPLCYWGTTLTGIISLSLSHTHTHSLCMCVCVCVWFYWQVSTPQSQGYELSFLPLCYPGTTVTGTLVNKHCLSPCASGRFWTLDLRIMSWMFYHCATQGTTVTLTFVNKHCLSPCAGSRFWTLDLRIMSLVFYHCATQAQQSPSHL